MRSICLAAALVLLPAALASQQPGPNAAPAKGAPTKGVTTAFAREQQVWVALKEGDIAAFNRLTNGTFTYIDPRGIVAWTPAMSEQLKDCTMASFTTEDVHTQQPAAGVVILSYKATQDQTCKGVKQPSSIYVLSVWQRTASSWRLVAHGETTAAPQE